MTGNVLKEFIKPMRQVFDVPARCKPKTPNPDDVRFANEEMDRFIAPYIKVLYQFDDETLAKAAQNIIETRMKRDFPMPAECRAACRETIEAKSIEKMNLKGNPSASSEPFESKYPEFSQYRIQAAYSMMKGSGLGQQAAEEYWIWGLHDFCREQQRLPEQHEIERIKAKSKKVIEDLNACLCAPVTNPDYLSMRGALLNNWVASYAAKCKMIDVEVDPDTVMKIFQHKDDSNA